METLERLESAVNTLMLRLEELRNENNQLKHQVETLIQEKAVCDQQISTLQEQLSSAEIHCTETINRINGLAQKVEDLINAG